MVRTIDYYIQKVSKTGGLLRSHGIFVLILLALEAHKSGIKAETVLDKFMRSSRWFGR